MSQTPSASGGGTDSASSGGTEPFNDHLPYENEEYERGEHHLVKATQRAPSAARMADSMQGRLRLVLGAAELGDWSWDVETDFVTLAPRAAEIFGVEPGRVMSWSAMLRLLHPDDREKARTAVERSIRAVSDYNIEYRVHRADGSGIVWVKATGSPILDDCGRVAGILGILENITERKEREHALRESEAHLSLVLGSISEGLFVLDSEWRFTHFNRAAEVYFGRPASDVYGASIWEVFPALVGSVFEDTYRRAVFEGTDQEINAQSVITGRWVNVRAFPFAKGLTVLFRDITEQRTIEEQLRGLTQRLQFHAENSPLAVIESDHQLRITQWNKEAERIFGWSAEETLGRRIDEFPVVHEEDRSAVHALVQSLADSTRPRNVSKNRNLRKDGSLAHSEWYNSALMDEKGALVSVLSLVLDVTERRRAEEEREEALAALQGLLEGAPLGIAVLDSDMRYRFVNERLARMNGLTAADHVGKSVAEIVPDLAAQAAPLFREVMDSGRPVVEKLVEGETPKAPGIRRIWSESWFPVQRADGRPCAVGVVVHEVTEQKRAEERFRASQEASLFGFAILRAIRDSHGRITDFEWEYVNPAAAELLGKSTSDLVGHRLLEVLPDSRETNDLFTTYVNVVETSRPRDYEIHYRGEGVDGWFRNMSVKLGDGVAVSFTDITPRRRAEEALREADRRKDEFLAMLAHELRNPLAAVMNAFNVLNKLGRDSETGTWAMEIIGRQCKQLVRLVDDLLDVSRISRGKISLQREPLDAGAVLKRALSVVNPTIEQKGHTLQTTIPDGPLPVTADPARLEQIYVNVLTNAAKYTDAGGTISVTAAEDDGWTVVRIRDTGVGIEPELIGLIFEPFAQVDTSLERSQGGLGIGLTLVKQLIAMHGGSVAATSAGHGAGSEFVLRIPSASEAALESVPRTAAAPHSLLSTTRETRHRILVVEDNLDTAKTTQRLLSSLGHEVALAHEGFRALDEAANFRPDVMLLDVGLPGMSGYEVAAALKRTPAGRRIVIIGQSGYGQERDRERSRECGFDHYLVKPVDFDVLRKLLEEIRPVTTPSGSPA